MRIGQQKRNGHEYWHGAVNSLNKSIRSNSKCFIIDYDCIEVTVDSGSKRDLSEYLFTVNYNWYKPDWECTWKKSTGLLRFLLQIWSTWRKCWLKSCHPQLLLLCRLFHLKDAEKGLQIIESHVTDSFLRWYISNALKIKQASLKQWHESHCSNWHGHLKFNKLEIIPRNIWLICKENIIKYL